MRFAPPLRSAAAALTAAIAFAVALAPAHAAQPGEKPQVERPIRAGEPMDAASTRQALMDLLRRHPPTVGRVLKLDPSLMANEAYMASYPELRQFLQAHPEAVQNAAFFFEPVRIGAGDWDEPTPHSVRLAQEMLGGLAALIVMTVILGTLIWLIRTVIEQRRWTRLSKIQAEVHSKVLDRFSSNDELLAYAQLPAGRRFLESGPSPLEEPSPAVGAPLSRILWSVQLGSVLLVAGLALLFLSARSAPEIREVFFMLGCMATALGAGFAVSAAVAYALSRRMGLLDRPVHGNA